MTTAKTNEASQLLTADDLLRLYSEGVRGELIRGVLSKTMPTGQEHGEIAMLFGFRLGNFIYPRKLGRLLGSDAGIRLERDPDTVREPDVAFISAEKLPLGTRNPSYAEVVPDLVVEIVSPGDSRAAVNDKALMWLRFGVRLVWVVYPESRSVEVFRNGQSVVTLDENDALDGGEVLPGFSCQAREIFEV